jgi:hypothetical protein
VEAHPSRDDAPYPPRDVVLSRKMNEEACIPNGRTL